LLIFVVNNNEFMLKIYINMNMNML